MSAGPAKRRKFGQFCRRCAKRRACNLTNAPSAPTVSSPELEEFQKAPLDSVPLWSEKLKFTVAPDPLTDALRLTPASGATDPYRAYTERLANAWKMKEAH